MILNIFYLQKIMICDLVLKALSTKIQGQF